MKLLLSVFRENAFTDCLFGSLVVAVSVGGFIMVLWLREQILVHGGPDWLNDGNENHPPFRLDEFIMNLVRNQVKLCCIVVLYL